MKYPKNIKTRKAKLAYMLFRQMYIFDTGRGAVMGRFTSIIPEIGVAILILDKFGIYAPTKLQIGLIFGVGLISCYLLGRWYMNHSLDLIRTQVDSERNLVINDLWQKLVKKKAKL